MSQNKVVYCKASSYPQQNPIEQAEMMIESYSKDLRTIIRGMREWGEQDGYEKNNFQVCKGNLDRWRKILAEEQAKVKLLTVKDLAAKFNCK